MIDIEDIAKDVVDSAIKVHRALGPGLLESAYQQCHAYELRQRGHRVLTEVSLPLIYEDQKIEVGYHIDTLVDDLIIIENKTVESFFTHPRSAAHDLFKTEWAKYRFLAQLECDPNEARHQTRSNELIQLNPLSEALQKRLTFSNLRPFVPSRLN